MITSSGSWMLRALRLPANYLGHALPSITAEDEGESEEYYCHHNSHIRPTFSPNCFNL